MRIMIIHNNPTFAIKVIMPRKLFQPIDTINRDHFFCNHCSC